MIVTVSSNEQNWASPHHAIEIQVEAFRGLREIKLEQLQRINLLVGGNNSGKTSILEAIAVLFAGADLNAWVNNARLREVRTYASLGDGMSITDAISWMFPTDDVGFWESERGGSLGVRAMTAGGPMVVRASFEPIKGIVPEELVRRSLGTTRAQSLKEPLEDVGIALRIAATDPQDALFHSELEHDFQLWSSLGFRASNVRRSKQRFVQYLSPYGHRDSSMNLEELSRQIRSNDMNEINSLLGALDDRVYGVEIITSYGGRYPKIAVRMIDGRVLPISVMGDGLRRALSIALAIVAARNGILLLDEIEAAFHIGVFEKVYRWLNAASEAYNVQIFATTHSLEAIEAIARASSEPKSVSAYSIGASGDEVVKRYTGGMLQRLVVERGLDIRN